MSPEECIQKIEEECSVFFWADSVETFPREARGAFEDGTWFYLSCGDTHAELIAGEYDPYSSDFLLNDFYSSTPCQCLTLEDYIDIFKKLIYTLDKASYPVDRIEEGK